MELKFKEWLLQEGASQPGAKQMLYPMGYGGIGLYPPADVMTWGADAFTYMPEKIRKLDFKWGEGMTANPFKDDDLYSKIKGKEARQIQVGNLKVNDTGFAQNGKYTRSIKPRIAQIGGLDVKDTGFKKSQNYVKLKPNKGYWDYKQIAGRDGNLALPITAVD